MIGHARDTVIFIHGYNVSFKEALTSTAQLKQNFSQDAGGPGVNVVLFSWPSDGSMKPFLTTPMIGRTLRHPAPPSRAAC